MGNKELNKKAIKELDKIYLNKIGADKKFRKKVMKVIDDVESLSKPDTSVIPVPGTLCNRLIRTGFKPCTMDIFERLGIDFDHGVVPFQYSYNILRGKINLDLEDDEHICYEDYHVILSNYHKKISYLRDFQSKISIADDIYAGSYVNILRFLSTSILDGCTNIKLRMHDIKVSKYTASMIDILRWDLFNIYFLYTGGWFAVEELQKYEIPIMDHLGLLGIFFTDYMPYEKFARYVPGCAGIRAFNIKDPDSPRCKCLEVTNSGDSYSYQRGYIDKASVDSINEKVINKLDTSLFLSHSGTDAKMTDIIGDVNKITQTIPESLLPQMYCLGITELSVDNGVYSFFNEQEYMNTIPWLHSTVYNMITEIINGQLTSTKSKDVADVAAILSI